MNAQIASAAEQQTHVSEEMTRTIDAIAQTSSGNSRLAERTHASSHELETLTGTLNRVTARLRFS